MVSRFSGREILAKPKCPFCGMVLERPTELTTRMPTEMPVGRCSCGAVYACDVTGHNLGTVEEQIKNYDLDNHLVIHGGVYQGRRIAGTLYFVRLHQDTPGVTEKGANKGRVRAAAVSQKSSRKKRGGKALSKKEVEAFVEAYDLRPLLNVAKEDKRIIRDLQWSHFQASPEAV
jgi:hypothetical protein